MANRLDACQPGSMSRREAGRRAALIEGCPAKPADRPAEAVLLAKNWMARSRCVQPSLTLAPSPRPEDESEVAAPSSTSSSSSWLASLPAKIISEEWRVKVGRVVSLSKSDGLFGRFARDALAAD